MSESLRNHVQTTRKKSRHQYKPAHPNKRRFAEECASGDVVEWAQPPLIRRLSGWELAPTATAEISMFIGPPPFVAFARFFLESGKQTRPFEVKINQPLVVLKAR
jgi:hypothetical protein